MFFLSNDKHRTGSVPQNSLGITAVDEMKKPLIVMRRKHNQVDLQIFGRSNYLLFRFATTKKPIYSWIFLFYLGSE